MTVARVLLLLVLTCTAAGCGGSSFADSAPTASAAPTVQPPDRTLVEDVVPDLVQTWNSYRRDFIQSDGRVVDRGRRGATTSEGQSYALLRAVWMGDRPTFDLVWTWTHNNLQIRPHDKLFGYLWGQHRNGSWSILSSNSATDADEDIALALVFAYHRWHAAPYLQEARKVIHSIWAHEVTAIRGEPVITAGNWAPSVASPGPQIDPSYFAPYAYRIFAGVDRTHPWKRVVDSSYHFLTACTESPLGGKGRGKLPPNWCSVTRTGSVAPAHETRPNLFGYDAFRTQWRIALDVIWYRDPRGSAYLKHVSFLRHAWASEHALFSQYQHQGKPVARLEDPTIYGGDIGNFVVTDPSAATQIATQKLLPTFHIDSGVAFWDQRYSYYEQNWVWFGLALVAGQTANLATVANPTTALSAADAHGSRIADIGCSRSPTPCTPHSSRFTRRTT